MDTHLLKVLKNGRRQLRGTRLYSDAHNIVLVLLVYICFACNLNEISNMGFTQETRYSLLHKCIDGAKEFWSVNFNKTFMNVHMLEVS